MTPAPVSECLFIDLDQLNGSSAAVEIVPQQSNGQVAGREQLGTSTHFSMKFPPRVMPSVLSWSSLLLACVNEPRIAAAEAPH